MQLLVLALTALVSASCGSHPASSASQTQARARVAASGVIAGQVTLTDRKAGTTAPFATELAVAKAVGDQLQLVAWVQSDAGGRFKVRVLPGTYVLVQKHQITGNPDDDHALQGYVEPFAVAAGRTVRQSFALYTPPPPISIGVGN